MFAQVTEAVLIVVGVVIVDEGTAQDVLGRSDD